MITALCEMLEVTEEAQQPLTHGDRPIDGAAHGDLVEAEHQARHNLGVTIETRILAALLLGRPTSSSGAELDPAPGCRCMPHRRFPCGHCVHDVCQDCDRCPCRCRHTAPDHPARPPLPRSPAEAGILIWRRFQRTEGFMLFIWDTRPHRLADAQLDDATLQHAIRMLVPEVLRDQLVERYHVDLSRSIEPGLNSGAFNIPRESMACVLVEAGVTDEDVRRYADAAEPVLLRRARIETGLSWLRVECVACTWKQAYNLAVMTEGMATDKGMEGWNRHENCPGRT
jgi:hypothetical protein